MSYRTEWYAGVVTALTSISHIGPEERAGQSTKSYLRREKIIQPDGSVEHVPTISGNGMRGLLRDRGMWHMCQRLGYGVNEETGEVLGLSLPAFHFLFSGGSLTSTGSKAIDIDRARKMREAIPLISLFGGALGNQILNGKIKIGKMIPICQETIHLLPTWCAGDMSDLDESVQASLDEVIQRVSKPVPGELLAAVLAEIIRYDAMTRRPGRQVQFEDVDENYVLSLIERWRKNINTYIDTTEEASTTTLMATARPYLRDALRRKGVGTRRAHRLISAYEFIQEETFTRKDDEKNERLREIIAPDTRALLEADAATKRELPATTPDKEVGQHQQMRYQVETLAAGTRLFWEVALEDVTDIEYDAFWTCMHEFAQWPFVGGKSGTGHGKVSVQFRDWLSIDPRQMAAAPLPDMPMGVRYEQHLRDKGSELRDLLETIV